MLDIDGIREKLKFFLEYPDKVGTSELQDFLKEISALAEGKSPEEKEKFREIRDRVEKMLNDFHSKDKEYEQMKSKYAKY